MMMAEIYFILNDTSSYYLIIIIGLSLLLNLAVIFLKFKVDNYLNQFIVFLNILFRNLIMIEFELIHSDLRNIAISLITFFNLNEINIIVHKRTVGCLLFTYWIYFQIRTALKHDNFDYKVFNSCFFFVMMLFAFLKKYFLENGNYLN
jgi:hypothetical protein